MPVSYTHLFVYGQLIADAEVLFDNVADSIQTAISVGTYQVVLSTMNKELSPQWVYEIFEDKYVKRQPYFQIEECHFKQVDGIMAVSYTHLDVYKRQDLSHSDFCC